MNGKKNYGRCSDTTTNKTSDPVQPYDISNSYTLKLVSVDQIAATIIYEAARAF